LKTHGQPLQKLDDGGDGAMYIEGEEDFEEEGKHPNDPQIAN
jgi:hypothetical protein